MIKEKITLLGCSIILLFNLGSVAQDAHFSQYYSAQTFLSPSMAGSSGGFRASTGYRNQWPGIQKAYQTYTASADIFFIDYHSGFGALVVEDKAGSANLNTLYLGLQYSYRLAINNLQLVPGLQFTLGHKSLDRSKLVFPDETVTETPSSGQVYMTDTETKYPDFMVSIFLYDPKFWFGAVADHLLRPNYSFLGDKTIIPIKFVSYGGYCFLKDNANRIEYQRLASIGYRFEYQDNFKQLDVGGYFFTKMLDFGFWYRGIPALKNTNTVNHFVDNDALVLSLGGSKGKFHITYSYDLQLSKLSGYGAGAHELSIVFEIDKQCPSCTSKRKANINYNKDRPLNMRLN